MLAEAEAGYIMQYGDVNTLRGDKYDIHCGHVGLLKTALSSGEGEGTNTKTGPTTSTTEKCTSQRMNEERLDSRKF